MTLQKKLLGTCALALLISACGTDIQESLPAKEPKNENSITTVANDSTEKKVTKLVAKPMTTDDIKEKISQKLVTNWHQGTVQFLNLEGGFYGIITDSGKRLLPMNLAKEFRQNGAIIRVKGKVKNVLTIQQWGTPFEISDIELVKPGNKSTDEEI